MQRLHCEQSLFAFSLLFSILTTRWTMLLGLVVLILLLDSSCFVAFNSVNTFSWLIGKAFDAQIALDFVLNHLRV